MKHELHAVFCRIALHAPLTIFSFSEHVRMAGFKFRQYLIVASVVVEAFYLVVCYLNLSRRNYARYRGSTFIAPVTDCAG